jgi:acyl dehydratase
MAQIPKLGPRDAGRLINHGFYYDQLEPGMKLRTMGRTITEGDLSAFCNVTWMLEEGFVNTRPDARHEIKGRFVPGMLVYTFAEGLLVPSFNFTGLAFLHNELNHTAPTVVGDTIHVEVEITEVRRASKGNRGLVRSLNHVVNHRDEVVLIYKPLRMMSGSPGLASTP